MVLHVGKAETGGSLWLIAKPPHLLGEKSERDPVLRKKWWTVAEEQHLILSPWFLYRHLDSQTHTFVHTYTCTLTYICTGKQKRTKLTAN